MKDEAPPPDALDGDLARLEEIYARWDAVHRRTGLETAATGSALGRAFGFLRRTLGRLRDLGIAADRERDLLRALLDWQIGLDRHLRAAVEERRRAELGIAARLDEGRDAIGALRDAAGALRVEQEAQRARQLRLDRAQADLAERVDGLAAALGRPAATGAGGPELPPLPHGVPLTPGDLAALLAALDEGAPRATAVEVSVQDARAEDLLLVAHHHFGPRLSAAGPVYRSPNDLWVHVDFTPRWRRPTLLVNAAARLAPGGRFVLVTAPGEEAPAAPPDAQRLRPAGERDWTAPGGQRARLLTWVRA